MFGPFSFMKTIVAISFYDDEPELFENALRSVIGADQIVCVDGPYSDWPHGGKLQSDESLIKIANACGAKVIKAPKIPWKHQIDKRNAYITGENGDWYLTIDADETVQFIDGHGWKTLKNFLVDSGNKAGACAIKWNYAKHLGNKKGSYFTGRKLFKHVDGVHYKNHHAYLYDKYENRLKTETNDVVVSKYTLLTFSGLVVNHHKTDRSQRRLDLQSRYYLTREHP